jgi:hypothetical protein
MITIRPARERGHGQHGRLDTRHTFSFNESHDPRHTGFRVPRAINEDGADAPGLATTSPSGRRARRRARRLRRGHRRRVRLAPQTSRADDGVIRPHQ